MGKKFIILFLEKEGSSPVVRLLNNFEAVNIVHQVSDGGWEPFDRHSCGPMPLRNYRRCLDLIYGERKPDDMAELNAVYTATARRPLAPFDKDKAVGFKMRFHPQHNNRLVRWLRTARFERESFNLFREHHVVVFLTVRQDVFRWALSRYHGDGTGRQGHLQFKLATGKIERKDVPPVTVDLRAFQDLLNDCERRIVRKRRLFERLTREGIAAYPLLYERFCEDPHSYFVELMQRLEIPVTDADVRAALERGTKFQKVHGSDIHEFVVNADDVLKEFGQRYVRW